MTSETKGPAEGVAELSQAYRALLDGGQVGWNASRPFLKPLGTGGQGVVYLSDRRGADGFTIPVAIKVFSPEGFIDEPSYVEAMGRIARISARIAQVQHDNLLNLHNFVDRGGIRILVMEWIDGYDLRQLLNRKTSYHFVSPFLVLLIPEPTVI